MEIDLDNLVFNGLDEAEERNAERLDDADKKPVRLSPMTTAAMPARSEEKAPGSRCFFMNAFCYPLSDLRRFAKPGQHQDQALGR